MKIAVIDNFDSFVYNLVRYLREIDEVTVTVHRNNSVCYQTLMESDAILLSPGPGIPSEAGELMSVIEQFAAEKPILGVCLGHQALALHFGGKLEQCVVPMHGKSSEIEHNLRSALFEDINSSFPVGRYHSWKVATQLPDCLSITAHYESEIMALEHKELPIYGVQFHPESILTRDGRKMIQNWVNTARLKKLQKTTA